MTFMRRLVVRPEAVLLAAWFAVGIGCGTSDGGGGGATASKAIDATGGTVSLPGGPTVVIPPTALGASTTITVRDTGQTAPSGGPIYEFLPAGTLFANPVTIQMAVPSGVTNPTIYWTAPGSPTQFAALPTTVSGSTATATVNHFSLGYVAPAPAAATPTFTPAAGTFTSAQSVTLSTTTPGAAIHYTTDGSTPTASSPTFTAAIPVPVTTTIKAIATASGFSPSAIATAAYVIDLPQAATPTFTPAAGTFTSAQSVTLSTTTPGAAIHYTTDGSTPTASSPTYTAAIPVSVTTTITAIATASGFSTSAIATARYVIGQPEAATPTFTPAAGTYTSVQSVTISSTTPGAAIHYTTDGSTPTASSPTYTAAIPVSVTTTITAIATATGFSPSLVATAAYVINLPQAATPTFTPVAGTYTSAQSVTILSTTPGAAIHYTTNGTTPTASSPTYTAAIPVSVTTTIQAIATATGYTQSAIASATYTIGSGTDFLTLCNGVQTAFNNLQVLCLHANPALLSAPGPFGFSIPCADYQRDFSSGRIVYSPAEGSACLSAVQAITCTDLTVAGGPPLPPSCTAALSGRVQTNVACYLAEECVSGDYCTSDWSLTCPGTCQPEVALSGNCSSAPCASGLTCEYSTGTGTYLCKSAGGLGLECPCEDKFWCDSSAIPPVCKAPQTSGACSTYTFGQCAAGYVCVGVGPTGTCLPLVGGDGNCAASSQVCGLGYQCVSNFCVPVPPVNAPCNPLASPLCIGGYCDASQYPTPATCVAFKTVGATCTDDRQCESAYCSMGQCAASFCAPP